MLFCGSVKTLCCGTCPSADICQHCYIWGEACCAQCSANMALAAAASSVSLQHSCYSQCLPASACLRVHTCLYVSLRACLSVRMSLSLCLSCRLFVNLPACLCVCLSVRMSVCLLVCLRACLYVFCCLSVQLSVWENSMSACVTPKPSVQTLSSCTPADKSPPPGSTTQSALAQLPTHTDWGPTGLAFHVWLGRMSALA